jgi:hypothetical protein
MLILYGSGMSDSNAHSPNDLPILLLGGGAGPVAGGRHVKHANGILANLHLGILDKVGVPVEKLGNSVAPLTI